MTRSIQMATPTVHGTAPRPVSQDHPPRLARIALRDYELDAALCARVMSPALVVYEDKVRHNVARMIEYAGGEPSRWRVHLKTTKIPEVYAMLVDAGLRAFKCATVREARCMLEELAARRIEGADLLIAYPLQGPSLQRAGALAAQFPATALSVLSEDADHAAAVPPGLGVFVDVNPGMHRTGIPLSRGEQIAAVARAAGVRLRGIHFYDGHIHDPTAAQRRAAAHRGYDALLDLLAALHAGGIEPAEVITSGTPSFRYALDYPGFAGGAVRGGGAIHRISPGTVVFHDFEYDRLLEDLDLVPAAVVLARVVSHPRDGVVTCDAGSKSLAAEYGNPIGFALGHPQMVGLSPSEEHLPMDVSAMGADVPALGSLLYLVPRHVCPTVNLAEQALLVRSGGPAEVVQVAGRAHDLLIDG
jgi:D-serine deaminase-like pyridoxal phosphate-dependent protein